MNKFLLAGIVAALVVGTYTLTYKLGSLSGADFVQGQWDDETSKRKDKIAELEKEYAALQAAHEKRVEDLTNDLESAEAVYRDSLASHEREFAQRLQQSQSRAGIYQRQAQGSSAERDRLAEHAARLDAALEEGRNLVKEYRTTLEQRDRTIRSLGIMLQNDRHLFNDE